MDTPRTVYFIDSQNPGSEVAGETAAALAAASIVFEKTDPQYSYLLLERSIQVFEFADTYRGSYNNSLGKYVCPFYCDWGGYQDELIWGASWLYKASNNDNNKYWQYILDNIHWLKPIVPSVVGEFGWDNKHGGVYVLLYEDLIKNDDQRLIPFQNIANILACTILPESHTKIVTYSPGGLLHKLEGSNMQNPSALSFLLIALAQRLHASNSEVICSINVIASPSRLVEVAKSQVRLYDISSQRKPVISINFRELPIKAATPDLDGNRIYARTTTATCTQATCLLRKVVPNVEKVVRVTNFLDLEVLIYDAVLKALTINFVKLIKYD